jgi:hypothetical protein
MEQVDQLRALECCTCGAGHRFPWPASRTVQGRRQKPIACSTPTQSTQLFHDKRLEQAEKAKPLKLQIERLVPGVGLEPTLPLPEKGF